MVPDKFDPRWDKFINDPSSYKVTSLALKVLMQRVSMKQKLGPSAADRAKLKAEVYEFFVKNERLVKVDVATIFG